MKTFFECQSSETRATAVAPNTKLRK